jgi:uncharacterized protein with PQ loop repeat
MVEFLGLAAAGWGLLMALSPIFQIRRILHRRSSADISMASLAVLQVGFGLWVLYAVAAEIPVLLVPNTMAFLVGVVLLTVAWRFRRT